jgi:glycerophosphoryl diester phosphodiesterase
MGAGILECDVTFTSDKELVCRHDQCDLHTTTNILLTPLAAQCTQPFSPAEFDASGVRTKAASALCCTSDLSLAQFRSLKGKMDASDPAALTPQEFQGGPPNWRYKEAGISPKDVFAQSFNRSDILYWIRHEPSFGRQAVYFDDRYETAIPALNPNDPSTWNPTMQQLVAQGVRIIAPPMWVLLTVENGKIVPLLYAREARKAGLDIITWTLERSGRIVQEVLPTKGTASPEFYYQATLDALHNDGDILVTLDVLARQVGILGIFSDWAATVSFYANCTKLK